MVMTFVFFQLQVILGLIDFCESGMMLCVWPGRLEPVNVASLLVTIQMLPHN